MKKIFLFMLMMMIFTTACNKDPEKVTEHDENHQGGNLGTKEDIEELSYAYPLTGLMVEESSENRAISVMINNHPAARPQTGLTEADIVYEVLAEGDVTRFLAIFQSEKPENIGPVRSSRDYYIELAKGYDSLYIAHGYSPEAKKLLTNGYIDNLNGMEYDGTLFKRASYRVAPHNSYISYSNILKGAEQKNYSLNQAPSSLVFLKESELESISGEEVSSVSIKYGANVQFNSSFQYKEDEMKFIRYSNGEQTVDYESNQPVSVDNVFIVEAKHTVIDNKGRKDIDITTGGNGYLLQRGKWREVTWKNVNGRILPMNNNQQIALVPGKTWINIIPSDPGLHAAVSLETR